MCSGRNQERGRWGISAESADTTVEMRAVRVPQGSVTAFPCKKSNALFGQKRGKMQDKKYLLSLSELLEKEATVLWKHCLRWLDEERLSRVKRFKGKHKAAENIGAGLLLQLAVWQAESEENTERQGGILQFTISELLACLEQSGHSPRALEYTYGANGKPYLKNSPYYFNLSHSGEYIFCVISMQEVGVDIQWAKPLKDDRIARRFFAEEEKQALAKCDSEQERQRLFYRLWVRKEAYGKLTGQGVAAILQKDIRGDGISETLGQIFEIEEFEIENYQIAVCKWKQES